MSLVSLYIDGTEGAGRAEVFASSATDATLYVDGRDAWRTSVTRFGVDHLDCSCGAMAGTVSAVYSVGYGDTVFRYQYSVADLGRGFLLACNRADGTRWTNLRTLGAFGTAISAVVRHLGLHQSVELGRG